MVQLRKRYEKKTRDNIKKLFHRMRGQSFIKWFGHMEGRGERRFAKSKCEGKTQREID